MPATQVDPQTLEIGMNRFFKVRFMADPFNALNSPFYASAGVEGSLNLEQVRLEARIIAKWIWGDDKSTSLVLEWCKAAQADELKNAPLAPALQQAFLDQVWDRDARISQASILRLIQMLDRGLPASFTWKEVGTRFEQCSRGEKESIEKFLAGGEVVARARSVESTSFIELLRKVPAAWKAPQAEIDWDGFEAA